MQFAERVVVQVVCNAPGFDKRRYLQGAVGAEQVRVVYAGAHLEVGDREVVVDKAAGAEAPASLGPSVCSHRRTSCACQKGIVACWFVLHKDMPGESYPRIHRVVLANLVAEASV